MKYCPECGFKNLSSLASKCEACGSSLTPKTNLVTFNPTIKKEKKSRPLSNRRKSKYNEDDEDEDEEDEDLDDDDYSDIDDSSAHLPRRDPEFVRMLAKQQPQTVSNSFKLKDLLDQ